MCFSYFISPNSLRIQEEGIYILGCPTNYVRVPTLRGYTDKDFCVSKYEMKEVGGRLVSQPNGNNFSGGTRNTILNRCAELGPEYDLITNDQWQTLARNIELVSENWSSGTVGVGEINRGHYTNFPNPNLPQVPTIMTVVLAQA